MQNNSFENNFYISNKTSLRFLTILFFAQLFLRMLSYLNILIFSNPRTLYYFDFALIGISVFYVCSIYFSRNIPKKPYAIIGNCLWFCFLGIIVSLANSHIYTSFVNALVTQSLWFGALLLFWVFFNEANENDLSFAEKTLSFATVIFTLIYFVWIINKTDDSEGYINCLYFGLCLLPTVFIHKKLWFRLFIIGFLTVNVILSGKRAALILFVLGLLIPLLTMISGRQKGRTIRIIIFVFLAVFLIYNFLSTRFDIIIFERMDNIFDDGGSGRDIIYERVWNSFKEASFIKKLFGHGFNSVSILTFVKTSAHNDFLEILYDYGIVGLIVYLAMLLKLIRYSRMLYVVKSQFAPMFLCAVIIFLVLSTFSHLIIYPTYIIFLLFFFSLGIYDLNRIKKEAVE